MNGIADLQTRHVLDANLGGIGDASAVDAHDAALAVLNNQGGAAPQALLYGH